MADQIVINASPLIALGKMGLLDLVRGLPFVLITPVEVQSEVQKGARKGHLVEFPAWMEVHPLSGRPDPNLFDRLDSGEAAVIQLALESKIDTVCLDETKGRRIAKEVGLSVTGSLWILGQAKVAGLIETVKPSIQKALQNGIYYDDALLDRFYHRAGE